MALSLSVSPPLRAAEPTSRPAELHGELSTQGSVKVLRVWGTAQQRGFAHGYLLAPEIKRLFEAFLADKRMSGGPQLYERTLVPLAQTMLRARPLHEREIDGIAEGIVARLGREAATISALNRPLDRGDLLALNALSDRFGPFCSSFAVWGSRTTDGKTLCARNLDWPRHEWMIGEDLLLVELPAAKPARRGWVSLGWPGFVGCLSGMNDAGLTLAMHDVPVKGPDGVRRVFPRGLVLREALEKCGGPDAIQQTADLFRLRPIGVGTNIFASVPFDAASHDAPAAVLEYDGRLDQSQGVTVRAADSKSADGWVACTNHFREREGVSRCGRYERLREKLSADKDRLDVEKVWAIATSVNVPQPEFNSMLTYHTLVFEPNARRLHFATADREKSAGHNPQHTFDLMDLLRRTDSATVKAAAH